MLGYVSLVAGTTRITVTLPTELVAALKELTDDVSGYVAEAVARELRHRLVGADLQRHQEEHGAFTAAELADARSRIFGHRDAGGSAGRSSQWPGVCASPPPPVGGEGTVSGV